MCGSTGSATRRSRARGGGWLVRRGEAVVAAEEAEPGDQVAGDGLGAVPGSVGGEALGGQPVGAGVVGLVAVGTVAAIASTVEARKEPSVTATAAGRAAADGARRAGMLVAGPSGAVASGGLAVHPDKDVRLAVTRAVQRSAARTYSGRGRFGAAAGAGFAGFSGGSSCGGGGGGGAAEVVAEEAAAAETPARALASHSYGNRTLSRPSSKLASARRNVSSPTPVTTGRSAR